jgi:hypothetical protein
MHEDVIGPLRPIYVNSRKETISIRKLHILLLKGVNICIAFEACWLMVA